MSALTATVFRLEFQSLLSYPLPFRRITSWLCLGMLNQGRALSTMGQISQTRRKETSKNRRDERAYIVNSSRARRHLQTRCPVCCRFQPNHHNENERSPIFRSYP